MISGDCQFQRAITCDSAGWGRIWHGKHSSRSRKVRPPLKAPVSSEVALDALDLTKKVSPNYSLLLTNMSCWLFVKWNTEMSRALTPLVLAQEVLKYRQHATHTNPIPFEDNPLSWWKTHGHTFPTISRFACRFLSISVTSYPVERLFSVGGQVDDDRKVPSSPDTMTLLVFMHEVLSLVRKIRTDRIVDGFRNFN